MYVDDYKTYKCGMCGNFIPTGMGHSCMWQHPYYVPQPNPLPDTFKEVTLTEERVRQIVREEMMRFKLIDTTVRTQ